MSGSLLSGAANAPEVRRWIYVTRRFSGLIDNLALTELQVADGEKKQAGVRDCLNQHYYGLASATENSMLTGSWGKHLRVRPGRDIDVMFVLPDRVWMQFEGRQGNKQSQLLQEVKSVLESRYGFQTAMRGDGQAVVIQFTTMPVDVVPAFTSSNGQFWICDTNLGGSYRLTDPLAEIAALDISDQTNSGVTRHLIRIAKQWQRHCNVPIRSFVLERLVIQFMNSWDGARDFFWYDWLVRDFFAYLVGQANGFVVMPGTIDVVPLGDSWQSRAGTAHGNAVQACAYEWENENVLAGSYWQSIFGPMIALAA